MYLCNDEFIGSLRKYSSDNNEKWRLVHDVRGRHVRLLQVSDLHFELPPQDVKERSQCDRYVQLFRDALNDWRRRFRSEEGSNFHGLIVSGDLVHAARLGYWKPKPGSDGVAGNTVPDSTEKEADQAKLRRAHEIAFSCIKSFTDDLVVRPNDATLIVPGNHDLYAHNGNPLRDERPSRICSFLETIYGEFGANRSRTLSDFCQSPKLCLLGERSRWVVGIIGLDSNHSTYWNPKARSHGFVGSTQLEQLKRTVEALRSAYSDTPVYIIVALHHHLLPVEGIEEEQLESATETVLRSVTLDTRKVIQELQALRVSLVLHGHMHEAVIQNVAYTPMDEQGDAHRLTIVGCPSFPRPAALPDGYCGLLALNIDMFRGSVQVDVLAKHSRLSEVTKSIKVPLVSISRVSSAEQRVKIALEDWLKGDGGTEENVCPPDASKVAQFHQAAAKRWLGHGYTQLCSIPADSGIEPSAQFPVAVDAPRLPTKKYRLLLLLDVHGRILLNNHIPIRDSSLGAWDSALLPAFSSASDFLHRLQADVNRIYDDLMIRDPRRAIGMEKQAEELRKAIGRLKNIDEDQLEDEIVELGTDEFVKFSPTDGVPQRYTYTLCALPHLALTVNDKDSLGAALCHLEQVFAEHCFRYEPDASKALSGYIWYPLEDWRRNAAIIARNADVMHWVETTLERIKAAEGGELPSWMILGTHRPGSVFSFEIKSVTPRPLSDLRDGLRQVPLMYNHDVLPYARAELKPVVIRREGNNDVRSSKIVVESEDGQRLGLLRPTQTYVLRQGLNRAKELRQTLLRIGYDPAQLAQPEIGHLTLVRGGVEFDILPPILETIRAEDCENPAEAEFLVADGNHRIVEYCWNEGLAVRCILAVGPAVPYYAMQRSSSDWRSVWSNTLSVTPDLRMKYEVRLATQQDLEQYVAHGKVPPKKSMEYRVFFRDFSARFRVGAQGGRIA